MKVNAIPGVGNTDDSIAHREEHFQQFVGDDGTGVGKAKQGMVREDGLEAEGLGVEHHLVGQCRESGMAVHYVDLLTDENVPNKWETGEEGG